MAKACPAELAFTSIAKLHFLLDAKRQSTNSGYKKKKTDPFYLYIFESRRNTGSAHRVPIYQNKTGLKAIWRKMCFQTCGHLWKMRMYADGVMTSESLMANVFLSSHPNQRPSRLTYDE